MIHYSLSLVMAGRFPGSPELNTISLTEQEYDELFARFKPRMNYVGLK